MLWCAVSLPYLSLDWRPPQSGLVAVVDRVGARRIVLAGNSTARAQGIDAGLDATVALARAPELRLLERSPADEARALNGLAGWACQFSSDICLDASRGLLWLEVGRSRRYFGGLDLLLPQIRDGIAQLGYTGRCATAPTLEAAALLARSEPDAQVLRREELRSVLGPRPLDTLAIDTTVLDHLRTVDLRSIDDLLAIPAAALGRRFGGTLTNYLQRLFGHLPDPRPRYRLPRQYRRRFDCTYPIATVEGLLFPLRRLLQELQGELRGRDMALQELAISLRHRDALETQLTLRTTTPQREAAQLFALLRETLDRTTLPQPVTEIRLAIDQFLPPDVHQPDLFDERARRDANWAAVLDKLRARLGEHAVRTLGLTDDHRPEQAWCVCSSTERNETPDDLPERPLWILEPQPLHRLPKILGTPERIEAGWWHNKDSSRDYYLARSPEGARWWLYREVATQRWFLHGLWG